MPNKRCAFIFATLLCIFTPLVSCCSARKYKLSTETLSLITESGTRVSVNAELALSQEERNWGFMERKSIPKGTGMLFVFSKDERRTFWMKNTPTALSIAYIGSDGVIYDIIDMVPYSEAPVPSSRSVRFALEVPQGWFAENGITVGSLVLRSDGSSLTGIQAKD